MADSMVVGAILWPYAALQEAGKNSGSARLVGDAKLNAPGANNLVRGSGGI